MLLEPELHKELRQHKLPERHKPSKAQHKRSRSSAGPSAGRTSQRGTSGHTHKPELHTSRQPEHKQPALVRKQLVHKEREPERPGRRQPVPEQREHKAPELGQPGHKRPGQHRHKGQQLRSTCACKDDPGKA
jgi:hypothetical protein